MAEFSAKNGRDCNHHHVVFSKLELKESLSLSPPPTPKSFRRGPMYSAYTELRDWNIRMRNSRPNASSPITLPIKRSSFSWLADSGMAFRKENQKPTRGVALGFDSCVTPPPPLVPKLKLTTAGCVSASRVDEKKKGNGGGGSGGLFDMRRSFSGFSQLKESSKVSPSTMEGEGRRGGGSGKVGGRRSFTVIERPKSLKATGFM